MHNTVQQPLPNGEPPLDAPARSPSAGSGCFSSSISLWSVRESASAPSGSSGDCQSDDVRFLAGAVHARNLGDSGAAFSVFNEARARLRQIGTTASLALLAV